MSGTESITVEAALGSYWRRKVGGLEEKRETGRWKYLSSSYSMVFVSTAFASSFSGAA